MNQSSMLWAPRRTVESGVGLPEHKRPRTPIMEVLLDSRERRCAPRRDHPITMNAFLQRTEVLMYTGSPLEHQLMPASFMGLIIAINRLSSGANARKPPVSLRIPARREGVALPSKRSLAGVLTQV